MEAILFFSIIAKKNISQNKFQTDPLPASGGIFLCYGFPSTCRFEPCCMNLEKENFLRTKFIFLLQKLPADTSPHWGKMNLQQMIEHFSDVVMVASGKIKLPIVTPPDKLGRFRDFMMSEKP